jgi:hypothetical protein
VPAVDVIPSACSVACYLLYCFASLQVAKVSVLVLGEHSDMGMGQHCLKSHQYYVIRIQRHLNP